ncbi:protein of unknown function [uncultured Sphingopyxis sp.]|uniref:Uncharacterized protein n=1 Tax=uncultured Sphingopyxis sp. TaxID=310581 RepID=A0A1Y5PVD2_9SPHN|nr:protein of unknown function [uncultured Sphingopyxis sp.]
MDVGSVRRSRTFRLEEIRKLLGHKVPKMLNQPPHFANGYVGSGVPETLGGNPVCLLYIGRPLGRPGPACLVERPQEFGEGATMPCRNF